jgi:PEGA domain
MSAARPARAALAAGAAFAARAALVAALVLVAGGAARADDATATAAARARAKALKEAGTRALDRGDAALALEKFRAAYDEYPSPNLRFNLGLALGRLRREPEAATEFQAFLEEATNVPDEARAYAHQQLGVLEARLGRLVIHAASIGYKVELDGVAVGITPISRPVFVTPGAHRVEARSTGYAPFTTRATVGAGARADVYVALEPLPGTPPPATPRALQPPPPPTALPATPRALQPPPPPTASPSPPSRPPSPPSAPPSVGSPRPVPPPPSALPPSPPPRAPASPPPHAAASPSPPPRATASPPPPRRATASPPPRAAAPPPPRATAATAARANGARHVAPIVVGVLGVGLFAIGAGLRISAGLDYADLNFGGAHSCAPHCQPSQWSGIRDREYAGDALLALGGAALAADVVLWILDARAGRARAPLALVPTANGVSACGRF